MVEQAARVSSRYPKLFHYTTVDAFRSIFSSQQFWATHYADLNDRFELVRFRLKVSDFITPTIRKVFEKKMDCDAQFVAEVNADGGIDLIVHREATMHLEILHRNTFGERGFPGPFICSFCAHDVDSYEAENGLLSQWRGYGAGGGVAVVLDTLRVEEKMKHEKDIFSHPINHIGDVKYDSDDSGIKESFFEVFNQFPKILKDFYSCSQPTYENIFHHFILGSTLVKHHAFHEEKEVRIVVSPRPTNRDSTFYVAEDEAKPKKKIKYRSRGDLESQYIELFGVDGNAPLPIECVIVGPSRIQNLNYQSICDLVVGSGINVVKSETPFLG